MNSWLNTASAETLFNKHHIDRRLVMLVYDLDETSFTGVMLNGDWIQMDERGVRRFGSYADLIEAQCPPQGDD